jgi:hypothetical protein
MESELLQLNTDDLGKFFQAIKLSDVKDVQKLARQYKIKQNISATLFYLKYLHKQIQGTIKEQGIIAIERSLYKTFVLSAVSIIESLFYDLIKYTKYWKQENASETSQFSINHDGQKIKIEAKVIEPFKTRDAEMMNCNELIKAVKESGLIGTFDHKAVFEMNTLRNRIHLHSKDYTRDYDIFDEKQYMSSKKVLFDILTNASFCTLSNDASKELYGFLLS